MAVVPITNTVGEKGGKLFGFGFIPLAVIPPPGSTTIPRAESPGKPSEVDTGAKTSLIVARLPRREGNPNQAGFLDSVNKELLIAVGVAGLVALLLTWLLSRRILGPVEALTAAAGRMDKSDLSPHVAGKS